MNVSNFPASIAEEKTETGADTTEPHATEDFSRAIDAMTGGRIRLPSRHGLPFLQALHEVCTSRQPIGTQAVVITPEHSYRALRAELVDQFHQIDLHAFASRIARHSRRNDEILLAVIGDDAPVLRRISLGPVRYALAGVPCMQQPPRKELESA
jgi:hypothetical protein